MNIKDKLKKINPKHKAIAAFVLPVIAVVAFVNFVVLPYNSKIDSLKAGLTQMESEISKSKVMERKLGELKAANSKLQMELSAATKYLPTAEEGAQLQDTITSMARESGVSINSWTPGPKIKGPGGLYEQSTITVDMVGGYHEFGHFLQLFDGIERMLTIQSLTMSSAKLQGSKMSIPVKMTIVAFSAAGGK
ncbi:MAG: type 4a pilus biogenesis protein PilO [Nitrospirae bacterium]|nr:type 4a pilus biogenesis protein PilO [Nitrospirota bacterium]MBI5696308.1 type 4a pilus biogenesis protein PilO [Nitrospirota bacterium]